ncbi:MAG: MT-A70 family methyltransferase, partial [Rhodosalinus sp.]
EPILLGTRGKPPVAAKNIRSTVASYDLPKGVVFEPGLGWPETVVTVEALVREHSRKPDAGYAAAEALMPDARRLELFSRATRPGWTSWGNEVGKFDAVGASGDV